MLLSGALAVASEVSLIPDRLVHAAQDQDLTRAAKAFLEKPLQKCSGHASLEQSARRLPARAARYERSPPTHGPRARGQRSRKAKPTETNRNQPKPTETNRNQP
eukprot:SAG31_NODE_23911_length_493_cov_0.619289_1_plen_103_part_10